MSFAVSIFSGEDHPPKGRAGSNLSVSIKWKFGDLNEKVTSLGRAK